MEEAVHDEESGASLVVVATRKSVNLVLLAALGLRKRPQWWTFRHPEDLPAVTVTPLTGGLFKFSAPNLLLPECFTISKERGNTTEDTLFSIFSTSQRSAAAYAFGKLADLHGFRYEKDDCYDMKDFQNQYCLHSVFLQTASGERMAMSSDKTHAVEDEKDGLRFLSVFTCRGTDCADEFETAMKRLLCWHAGLDVRPGWEDDENDSPVDFRIEYFHLERVPPDELELRLDVRTANLWACLIDTCQQSVGRLATQASC
jgi:hypothetical protein